MSDAGPTRVRMSAERWNVLEPLLDAALDQPTAERRAYLVTVCGPDQALLAELLLLLRETELPDAELDSGVGAIAPALLAAVAPRTLDVPDVLADRYRIVRELGQGGMSVVFLADDLRLQRRVAVKVLRREVRLRNGGERFIAEIRLTANLRHRNIVPLFDSGEVDGWTFFVMPFIEGETLMQQLSRDGAHGSAAAVGIVTDIAAALSHAHGAGVVHRDVKPSNIMLADGQALLMDFGIARAPSDITQHFTQPGFTVGTPAYMSPEQCVGDATAGPASDIYSLGGVLYELLTGQPPVAAAIRIQNAFPGVTPRRVRRTIEPVLPTALAAVIERAMRLEPLERYASASEFSKALALALSTMQVGDTPANPTPTSGAQPAIARFMRGDSATWLVSGVTLLALISVAYSQRPKAAARGGPVVSGVAASVSVGDTSRIVLLPLEYNAAIRQRAGSHDLLRDALMKWTGVTVVDAAQTREALSVVHPGPTPLTAAEASRVAAAVGAGRYLRRDVTLSGTQTYLHAELFEAGSNSLRSEKTVNLGAGMDTSATGYSEVADEILLDGVPNGLRAGAFVGTRSRPALQLFARGVGAVDRWDLAAADSALDLAVTFDSAFARSEVWLAQVRVWRQSPVETWSYLVNRAQTRRTSLAVRDQQALDALTAQARGDTRRACGLWERFAATEATDFSAWYGAANCERADDAVLRDARSPSGWRFRASYHHAAMMYTRAFQILPAVHREFRATWFSGIDDVLFTSPTQLRFGVASPPDTGLFMAYPSWDDAGDSLTFVPFPLRDITMGQPWTYPASHRDAVRHQRELLRRVATTWRAVFPASADAMLAVAVSVDKLGDASAIDSLRVAGTLAVASDERLRIAIAQVWLQVKYGMPDDVRALRAARLMADSLLQANPNPPPAMMEALASIALLTGRVSLGTALANSGYEMVDEATQAPVKKLATRLQILAAAGVSPDSIARLEKAVLAGIELTVISTRRNEVRQRLVGRAATLAFPAYHSPMLAVLAQAGRDLPRAQESLSAGDSAAVRKLLEKMALNRRAMPPEFVKLETLLPESELLMSIGDFIGARERLASTLDAQSVSELEWMKTPIGAAVLVRAIGLRALLAARVGDRAGAARWARAYMALWGDAEPMLRSQVARVAALVG